MIKKSLEKNNNKRKLAAKELGISERTLYRKIKQYDLISSIYIKNMKNNFLLFFRISSLLIASLWSLFIYWRSTGDAKTIQVDFFQNKHH